MLRIIKNKIINLAKQAVFAVEAELKGESGQNKKVAAVKYVIERLPFPGLMKQILGMLLSVFIDSAIEIAVAYMNDSEIAEV